MTIAPSPLSVPLRTCTPWCEVGDRHDGEHPDDRACWSTYNVIPLSHHKPMNMGGGEWWQAYLNVYLRRRPKAADPLVYIHSEDTDAEIKLSVSEARELHRVLGVLLAQAEPGQS